MEIPRLSREEIVEIAKQIAERISSKAQACRCGMAMWDSSVTSKALLGVIDDQYPPSAELLTGLMDDILQRVEQNCGVAMSKPRELTKRLDADIKKGDWRGARVNHALLHGSILGPFEECAHESNPNPSIKGV